MNYDVLKELLGMMKNYGANIETIEINSYCANVYFESENKKHYEYFTNLWNCDMHDSNDSYVRFYLS